MSHVKSCGDKESTMANTMIDETAESKSPTNPQGNPENKSDLIDNQIASAVLKATIPALLILITLGIVAVWIGGAGHEFRYIPVLVLVLSLLAIGGLVRVGRISIASRAYIPALCMTVLSGMILNGGVHALAFPALLPILAMTGWLFGARTAVTFAVVSALTGGAFVWLAAQGWLHKPPPPNAMMIWLSSVGFLLVTLSATAIPSRMLRQALLDSESRRLEAERVSLALADRERTLRENEEFRRRVFDSSRVPIVVMDATTLRYVDCNAAATEIYRFSSIVETLGKTPMDVSAPIQYDGNPSAEKARHYIEEALTKGSAVFEWCHQRPDRELWDAEVHLMSFRSGESQFLQFTLQDITERKKAEEALRESEAKFRLIAEQAPVAMAISDPEQKALFYNQRFKDLFGYAIEDAPTVEEWWPLAYPEETYRASVRERWNTAVMEAIRDRTEIVPQETLVTCKNGEKKHIEWRMASLGHLNLVLGTDLTEHKAAEEALRNTEARYRDIVENAPMGIFRRELEGAFIYVNPCLIRQFQCKAEKEFLDNYGLLSKRWAHQERYEEFKALLLENRSVYGFENELRLADGTTKWFELYSFLDDSDQFISGFSLDITERKRAESALRQSEARLNTILSSLNDIVFEVDLHGRFEGYHAPISKKLYVQPDYFLGKNYDEVLPAHVSMLLRHAIEAIISGSPYQQFDYHMTIDNAIQWEHAVITPRYNASDEIIGLTAVCRDITERKKAEETLQEYQKALENSPDMIALVDLNYRYVLANNAFIVYRNARREDVVGRAVSDVVGSEIFEKVIKKNLDVCFRGETVQYEMKYEYTGLGERDILVSYYPLEEAGCITRVMSVIRDITDLKRAEERILRLATVVEQVTLDVVITDPDGTILYTNPSVTRTLGYSAEELLGKNPRFFKSGRHDQAFYKQMWSTIKAGQSWVGRLENLAKDGRIVLQNASISPIMDGRGEITGFVATRRDVTKEVEMETHLAQGQKMEAIGTLAAGIAHDFNNILSPIVGYVELARMKTKNDPELSDYLDQVSDASSRATDLVRQILSLSRKKEQKKTPLQASLVVKEALKLLRASIPTSIEIRQEFATQALILADPTQIHQVVINLCTNGYHAMEKTGGLLTVSLKKTEIPNEKDIADDISPGSYVVLEVSDTGCGMDKETQAKIFEPYFTTKETGKGTGLGLAVVHGIVKDHQGMITVDSEPGKGSRFRVYLPLTEGLKHAALTIQEEATPTKLHEHILFVDDEAQVCSMVKEYLSQYGYIVDVCSNGRDALFAFEQDLKAYDLLITDMTMPGINGGELAKKILSLRPDLPVILCTGYSSLIDHETAAAIGISAYMEKPLVMKDLICRVREVLKNST